MCDFVKSIKLAQQELYQLYCDFYAEYEDLAFDEFNSIQALLVIPFLLVIFKFEWWKRHCIPCVFIC